MDFSQYDDATRALAERTESMWDGFYTALIPTASKLLEIARGMGDTALEGFALYALAGGYYMFDPQGPGFTMAIREALACFQDVEDYTMVRRTYNLLAIHAILEGSHITGLDYLYESLNAFGGETNPYLRGIAEANIAHIYADLGAYPQAVLNAKRAIRDMLTGPDAENDHAQMNAIVCYCQLGGYQLELNPPAVADAQECYEQAELIASRMEYDVSIRISLDNIQMKVAHARGDAAERDRTIDDFIDAMGHCSDIADLTEDFCDVGDFLLGIGDETHAKALRDILHPVIDKVKIPFQQTKILDLEIGYYRLIGDDETRLTLEDRYYLVSKKYSHVLSQASIFAMQLRSTVQELSRREAEVEQENERLVHLARYDQLTEVPNRYLLNTHADEAFGRALDAGTPFAVEILDIDEFKKYNDTYGHQTGDACLQALASVLRREALQLTGVFVARYGGDEFVVIYEGMDEPTVLECAERLQRDVQQLAIEGVDDRITISQGICLDVPYEGTRLWDFLYVADNALYNVKRDGKNGIRIFHGTRADAEK